MNQLSDYIFERIRIDNIKHKYDFSSYISLGRLRWYMDDSWLVNPYNASHNVTIDCEDWYCCVASAAGSRWVIFWSPESEWVFAMNTDNIKHHDFKKNFLISHDSKNHLLNKSPEKAYKYLQKPENLFYTLTQGSDIPDISNPDKMEWTDTVDDVLNAYEKYNGR